MDMDLLAADGRRTPRWLIAAGERWSWPSRRHPIRLRDRRRVPARCIVAGVAALILLDGVASLVLAPASRPQAPLVPDPDPPAPAAWADIADPPHLYALPGSTFARLPMSYTAERSADGDQRQDDLAFGSFGGPSPLLHLSLLRHPGEAAPLSDFVIDITRLAATSGLAVTRIAVPLDVRTRFGVFDAADVTLEHAGIALPCLGFRLATASPLGMTGVACGSEAAPIDRSALACALDRIDLVSAVDDGTLRGVFTAADRRHGEGCPTPRRLSAASNDRP